MLWSQDVGPEVVELSLFPDACQIDMYLAGGAVDISGRAKSTCASLFTAGMFIYLQSLIGGGDFF
jgi:3-polyprenyl-4-hydroxybenzoate decarboxylase